MLNDAWLTYRVIKESCLLGKIRTIRSVKNPTILKMRLICKEYAYGTFSVDIIKSIYIAINFPRNYEEMPPFWKKVIHKADKLHLAGISKIDDASPFKNLKKLSLTYMNLKNINQLITVENLSLNQMDQIDDENIRLFANNKRLKLSMLENVTNIDCLGSVEILKLEFMKRLTSIKLENVEYLQITHCINLSNIEPGSVQTLILNNVPIRNVNALKDVKRLHLINLKNLTDVNELHGVEILRLVDLNITDVSGLGSIPCMEIKNLRNITDVNCLRNVQKLGLIGLDIDDVSELGNIKFLYIHDCPRVRDVSNLSNVESLSLSSLPNLKNIDMLYTVKELSLIKLKIKNMDKLINDFGNYHKNAKLKIISNIMVDDDSNKTIYYPEYITISPIFNSVKIDYRGMVHTFHTF